MTNPKTPPKKTPIGDEPEQEPNPLRTKTFWFLVLLALGAMGAAARQRARRPAGSV